MHETTKAKLSIFAFVLLLATIIVLIATGILKTWALQLGALGLSAHFIFFFLFLLTGQPFGWGYSMFTQICGFVFGWQGLITAECGTLVGGLLGFYTSKRCLKTWATKKIQQFPARSKRLVDAARRSLSQGQGSFMFFTVIRMTPALTFGWVNGLCGGATEMPLYLYIATLVVGTQMDMILNIFIGTVAREANDAVDTAYNVENAAENENLRQNNSVVTPSSSLASAGSTNQIEGVVLSVQIVLAFLLLIGTTWWSRYLLKKIVEQDQAAQEQEQTRTDGVALPS